MPYDIMPPPQLKQAYVYTPPKKKQAKLMTSVFLFTCNIRSVQS